MKRVSLSALVIAVFSMGCFWGDMVFAEPVKMRVSLGIPEHHFISKQYAEWAKMIEQNSKGTIKPELYYSAQLYRDNEVLKAIQTGAIEAGYVLSFVMENQLVPAMKVLQMPFLYQTLDEALKVLHSDIGEGMKKTAEQKGVKLLGFVSFSDPEGDGLMTRKLVKVPSDVKGIVLRTLSPETSAMMKKWGAGPSFITGAELYLGMQRGTIQGSIVSVSSMIERKLYEVAPYMIILPMISVHSGISMNKAFFDRLTPIQQKVIMDASAVIDKNNYGIAISTYKKDLEELKKKAKVYFPSEAELVQWRAGCEEVWAETARSNKDVADALIKVRAMLKR